MHQTMNKYPWNPIVDKQAEMSTMNAEENVARPGIATNSEEARVVMDNRILSDN